MLFRPQKIGLTGGIGAGKSVATQCFADLGVPVISADALAREILQPTSPALHEIAQKLGAEFLLPDGSLDRAKLRASITQNQNTRKILDSITHPRIQALSRDRIQALLKNGADFVIYEAPLLFEANSEHNMDAVICVTADDAIRLQRIMKRDQCDKEQAQKLMATQISQDEKARRSDFILVNSGGLAEFKAECKALYQKICSLPKQTT